MAKADPAGPRADDRTAHDRASDEAAARQSNEHALAAPELDALRKSAEQTATDRPHVHDLQGRAGSAFDDADAEAGHDPGQDPGQEWSPRKKALFIVGASAACWALILLPLLF